MKNNTEKLTIIRLGGKLGQKFGKVHRFYVSSAAEAVRAMTSQFEGFAKYLTEDETGTLYKVFVNKNQVDPEKELHMESGSREIRISPVPQGAKNSGLFQAVLGAALIGLSFVPGLNVALWAGASNLTLMLGTSLALGGVAAMISGQSSLSISDAPENTPSKNFNGPVNTTSAGRPIPLVYGEGIVGSATISAGIYTSDTNA